MIASHAALVLELKGELAPEWIPEKRHDCSNYYQNP